MKRLVRRLLVLFAVFGFVGHADAHIGNKDIFEQVSAGPYKLFVTIRTPTVIPGVAMIEVRTSGPTVQSIRITPIPLTGEAAKHPPISDATQRSTVDPAFFTGSLWLMSSGSWQVRFEITGAAGAAVVSVPVPAVPLAILPMQRPLGIALGVLGLILVFGMSSIVAAGVRESRLTPGAMPTPDRRRLASVAAVITFAVVVLIIYAGGKWWNVEAAGYAANLYRPLDLHATLTGNVLDLAMGEYDHKRDKWLAESTDDILPDHGHLMHLYAIREPGMDAAFHLHPSPTPDKHLSIRLPAMPPGNYKLYADIVRRNGFPETLSTALSISPGLSTAPLSSEDASAAPAPLSAGELGPVFRLPDGYTMIWDKPAYLTASTAYTLRFRLVDSTGKPAADMQPYLGMAGHAAFVKADGTTFAHTHPEGSAAMPAMMLANAGESSSSEMPDMPEMNASLNLSATNPNAANLNATAPSLEPVVDFPYGFPSSGRYRIFLQMKHANVVETGVFDAEVH